MYLSQLPACGVCSLISIPTTHPILDRSVRTPMQKSSTGVLPARFLFFQESKPFFREQTKSWYCSINGKKISLGKNKPDALAKFYKFKNRGRRSIRPSRRLQKDHAVENDSWLTQLLLPLLCKNAFGSVRNVNAYDHIHLVTPLFKDNMSSTYGRERLSRRPATVDR